jgi:hypothetical protein
MKLAYAEHQSSFDEYSLIEQSERISNIEIDDLHPSDVMDMIEQECKTDTIRKSSMKKSILKSKQGIRFRLRFILEKNLVMRSHYAIAMLFFNKDTG